MEQDKYLRFFGVVGFGFVFLVFFLVGFFQLKRRLRNYNLGNETYFKKVGFIQHEFFNIAFLVK